jgi:hypothetical protein
MWHTFMSLELMLCAHSKATSEQIECAHNINSKDREQRVCFLDKVLKVKPIGSGTK